MGSTRKALTQLSLRKETNDEADIQSAVRQENKKDVHRERSLLTSTGQREKKEKGKGMFIVYRVAEGREKEGEGR